MEEWKEGGVVNTGRPSNLPTTCPLAGRVQPSDLPAFQPSTPPPLQPSSPPGYLLQETLAALGMPQAELAQRMGRPAKTINGIIKGKVAITFDTALQLERVLGRPAGFWMEQEGRYREALARQAEARVLAGQAAWLRDIPVAGLVEQGWLNPAAGEVEQLRGVLRFFGVASPAQWRELWLNPAAGWLRWPAFRRQPGAGAAWLRQGEIQAQAITCAPYDAGQFRRVLAAARRLTAIHPNVARADLARQAAAAGVAVVWLPAWPGLGFSGATRWLNPAKALIQLDPAWWPGLWPAFFHQAGHLLLHGKREVFLEPALRQAQDAAPHQAQDALPLDQAQEEAADEFAAEWLVPGFKLDRLVQAGRFDPATVAGFAASLGVGPEVVTYYLTTLGLGEN